MELGAIRRKAHLGASGIRDRDEPGSPFIKEKDRRLLSYFVCACAVEKEIKLQILLKKTADNNDDYSLGSNKAGKKQNKKKLA